MQETHCKSVKCSAEASLMILQNAYDKWNLFLGDAEEVPEWEEVKGRVYRALPITAQEAAEEESSQSSPQ